MTTPDVHELPRFDPLRNESIERMAEIQQQRLSQWRQYADQRAHDVFWMTADERNQLPFNPTKVCPKR